MQRFDWKRAETEPTGGPEGFSGRAAVIGKAIGAEHLAGQLIVLEPGDRPFPYHWEAGQEEWLLVLGGEPSVRTPDGEYALRPGDVVCFPVGPAGAHAVSNPGSAPARLIIFSNRSTPNVVVYPDSGKVGVRAPDVRGNFLTNDAVDYWEGEA